VQSSFPEDLFEGLTGRQREERLTLLRWLAARGVELDKMREAVREGNLALLPTELILTSRCRYTIAEGAREAGLSPEFLARVWRAAGLAVPGEDDRVLDEEDLDAVRFARQVLDAGFSEEAYVDISRVVGRGASSTAETLLEASIERFLEPTQSEEAFAMRLQEIAEQLAPLLPVLLALPVRMHLRVAIRRHALERPSQEVIGLSGTREMGVGFADMVGFTELSETVSIADSAIVATRLERLAAAVAEAPVRLIKLIGDAAMLVSDEPVALVEALLELGRLAERDDRIPQLRMGVASGEVAARYGDVYGRAVNVASRLADLAAPGQLLASPELAEQLPESFETRALQTREVKGIGPYRPVQVGSR
jgi:adenylate cyclase